MESLDFYTPYFLIVGGLLGLLMATVLDSFLTKRGDLLHQAGVSELQERFRRHRKVSWLMVAVGSLWVLQSLMDIAWAAGSRF